MDRRKYRARLLKRTLRYVSQRLPFYRCFEGRQELRIDDFPLIDAQTMREREDELVVLDSFPDVINLTGGSSGVPSFVFQNSTEWEWRARHASGIRAGERINMNAIPGFVLHVHGRNHGIPYTSPHGFPYVRLPLGNAKHGTVIANLLKQGLKIGGRRLRPLKLVASAGLIRRLTAFLVATGFDMGESPVRSIGLYGKHVSSSWIKKLQAFWGVPVALESFGLTEFNYAVATLCRACGGYHFPETIYPEFLAPDRSGSVDEGEALLVLTSLVPFVHVQPRVRYVTNDIVRLLPHCEVAGERGFVHVGRLERCLLVRDSGRVRSVLTAVDALEAIDRTNDVHVNSSDSSALIGDLAFDNTFPYPPGYPMFDMKVARGLPTPAGPIEMLVETIIDPISRPDRAQAIAAELHDNLAKVRASLGQDLLAYGFSLDMKILAQGGLQERNLTPVTAY